MLINRFHQMEVDENLFLLSEKEVYVWDVLRYDIYMRYAYHYKDWSKINSRKTQRSRFGKILVLLKSLLRHILIFKKYDYLIITSSRYVNPSGSYYDKVLDDAIKTCGKNRLVIERYTLDKTIYDSLYTIKSIFRKIYPVQHLDRTIYDNIKNICTRYLGDNSFTYSDLDKVYIDFMAEHKYYSWLLKKIKCKRILLNEGNPKAIVKAAETLRIPTVLFQHGEFSYDMVELSYPRVNSLNRIYFPQYYCTFSDLWGRECYIPSKIVPIGNNSFCEHVAHDKIGEIQDGIVFISSFIHSDSLAPLCKSFAKDNPDKTIIYKLHPEEAPQKEYFLQYFSGTNVVVVSNEYDTNQLLRSSLLVVLISSTVLYMAFDLGCKIAIYMRDDYERNLQFKQLPNCYFVENQVELSNVLLKPLKTDNSNSKFYSKLNEELLYTVIKL